MQRRIFLASVPAAALLPAQNTPVEAVFREWLASFNSGDKAAMEAFLKKREPEQLDRLDGYIEFHSQTGGFELLGIEKVAGRTLVARLKEKKSPTVAMLEMEVSDATPATIANLRVRAQGPPAGPAPARMSLPEALAAVEAEAATQAKADRFAGTLLIARDGKVLLDKAYGMADREAGTPNTVGTQFRIGSMNKMFTAVAALRLVERGKLSLDDAVGKHIKDYPNADVASKVRLRHLLSHTGGTGDIFGLKFQEKRLELRTHSDYLKLYGERGPQFEPGSRWSYSNYGMVLVGALIEHVSGEDYYTHVRKSVFATAGMKATDSLPESERVPLRSVGYLRDRKSNTWAPNTGTLPWRGTAAGGGYSTVGDLFRFAEALLNGKLLGAELLREATSVQGREERSPAGNGYGFGFGVEQTPMRRYGHGGGAPGMNGDLVVLPDHGIVVAVLANLDPPAAGRLSQHFCARIPLTAE